ncbi:hypothetical protein [Plantactinospora endophytica]|uniref:Uncharacterized protein n=1 Tax=Plantactinospora endophytica TaxID=673535 RepID=A0ABQ4DZS8_9ACTN|nr:hypothetical protein [Plantactinospora endophytica]GIG87958.1 hypothetical protein Pen02_28940 [Plantactinospora endophytica]
MIGVTWDRPLEGITEVPWDAMLGPAAPALIAALRKLAEHTGTGPAPYAADPIDDVIADDVDYSYMRYAIDHGYWPAGVPVIRFLARIAAAHPSDGATVSAIELINQIVNAPMDRPGAPDAELDAWVDGLRGELHAARPAFDEAARLVPAVRSTIVRLAERSTGGTLAYAGSYEPRWRRLAREVARLPGRSIKVVAGDGRDLLVVGDRHFLAPESGDVVAMFAPPRPGGAVAFTDADGPGVLTVEGPRREGGHRGPLRLWRRGEQGWEATRFGPRLRPWPLLPGVVAVTAGDGDLYVGYSDGRVTRRDSRAGYRLGPTLRVSGPGWSQRLYPYRDGSERRLLAVGRDSMYDLDFAHGQATEMPMAPFTNPFTCFRLGVRRCFAVISGRYPPGPVWCLDAVSGSAIGPPIRLPQPAALCAYELGGRPMLAIGSGQQLHRFDAETGEPAGPPLSGHRRDVTGIAAVRIAGRATLFSVDGATVRRWDAASGTPWPAPFAD